MGEPQQQQQQQQPTFSWTGAGQHEGSRIYYSSFNFSGEPYALGDCVYLLPEEEGAPPYIAKLMRAWEDTAAVDAEKLIIEVRRAAQLAGIACRTAEVCVQGSSACRRGTAGNIQQHSATYAHDMLCSWKGGC
jgi:hypothetical protein